MHIHVVLLRCSLEIGAAGFYDRSFLVNRLHDVELQGSVISAFSAVKTNHPNYV